LVEERILVTCNGKKQLIISKDILAEARFGTAG